jgi:hypothetical protein
MQRKFNSGSMTALVGFPSSLLPPSFLPPLLPPSPSPGYGNEYWQTKLDSVHFVLVYYVDRSDTLDSPPSSSLLLLPPSPSPGYENEYWNTKLDSVHFVLVYHVNRPDTLDHLASTWIPFVKTFPEVPFLVAGFGSTIGVIPRMEAEQKLGAANGGEGVQVS